MLRKFVCVGFHLSTDEGAVSLKVNPYLVPFFISRGAEENEEYETLSVLG
jgi:hypothetical protein